MQIIQSIPSSWRNQISASWSELKIKSWEEKIRLVVDSDNITPERKNLFKALELCDFENVKVVILGQDPYPTPGHANGLAFSTEDFVQPFPKSLLNIFKELKRTIPDYDFPLTGNLKSWAQQGVLMLNTCLTTEKGEANAHSRKGWEDLTSLLITSLFSEREGLVGMFWGNQAQEFAKNINKKGHLLLTSSHPSPLSVYRGFNSCNHFNLCNEYLSKKDTKPINWQT